MAANNKNAWYRSYHGMVSDDKWPLVARKSGQPVAVVVAIWCALLECASQEQERGSIEAFDSESMDVLFGLEDGACDAVLKALGEGKNPRIVEGRLVNWSKRQPKRERDDDCSTDRVRDYRDRQRLAEDALHDSPCDDVGVSIDNEPCNGVKHHETPDHGDETPCNAQIRGEEIRGDKNMRGRGNSAVNNAPKRSSAPLPKKSRSEKLSVPVGELEPFAAWVKSLRDGWCIGKMTEVEIADLEKAYLSLRTLLTADEQEKVRRYFDEMPANGSKWDYPPDRALFLASFPEIVQKAFAWWRRMKYKTSSEIQAMKEKVKPVESEPPMTEEERAEALKELREMKQECV